MNPESDSKYAHIHPQAR